MRAALVFDFERHFVCYVLSSGNSGHGVVTIASSLICTFLDLKDVERYSTLTCEHVLMKLKRVLSVLTWIRAS